MLMMEAEVCCAPPTAVQMPHLRSTECLKEQRTVHESQACCRKSKPDFFNLATGGKNDQNRWVSSWPSGSL
jgi:hypothetical protein